MTKIFVGTSAAAKSQAKAFIKGCSVPEVTFLPWWDQFIPGRTLLEELSRIRSQINRAILIISPESFAKIRGRKQAIPALNVLFEFGFFYNASAKRKLPWFAMETFTCHLILTATSTSPAATTSNAEVPWPSATVLRPNSVDGFIHIRVRTISTSCALTARRNSESARRIPTGLLGGGNDSGKRPT